MTPDEARDIIASLGWSQTFLVQLIGRDSSRTRRQFRGAEPFDEPLAEWLRALGRLAQNPPPKPPRRGPPHDERRPDTARRET